MADTIITKENVPAQLTVGRHHFDVAMFLPNGDINSNKKLEIEELVSLLRATALRNTDTVKKDCELGRKEKFDELISNLILSAQVAVKTGVLEEVIIPDAPRLCKALGSNLQIGI